MSELGLNLGELIAHSQRLRREEAALNQRLRVLKETRELVDRNILAELEEQGLERISTTAGTVSRGERTFARIVASERPAFFEWLTSHPEGLNLLANGLSADALLEYETVYGELPPGTAYHKTATVRLASR